MPDLLKLLWKYDKFQGFKISATETIISCLWMFQPNPIPPLFQLSENFITFLTVTDINSDIQSYSFDISNFLVFT